MEIERKKLSELVPVYDRTWFRSEVKYQNLLSATKHKMLYRTMINNITVEVICRKIN